jgi:hypothetical protein
MRNYVGLLKSITRKINVSSPKVISDRAAI